MLHLDVNPHCTLVVGLEIPNESTIDHTFHRFTEATCQSNRAVTSKISWILTRLWSRKYNSFLSIRRKEERKEMFYLTTHSTHFIYSYMASDIWLRTILIVREETCCRHIGYSFRLAARVILYAPSHRQDSTYHGLCNTSRGALAPIRRSAVLL